MTKAMQKGSGIQVRKAWPLEEREAEQSRGVLYCEGLYFIVWLWMSVGRRGSPIYSTSEVSKKVDKWAGWEMCWRQACNNILHNTNSKVLKLLSKTIWLWNATHHLAVVINLSHGTDMAVAENCIKTD